MCAWVDVEKDSRIGEARVIDSPGLARGNLLLVDIHLGDENEAIDGLDFVSETRDKGNEKRVMIVSGDGSPEQFCRAARAGANDYYVKMGKMGIADAAKFVLFRYEKPKRNPYESTRVREICYFRCFELTNGDIIHLDDFVDAGLPEFEEFAKIKGVSHDAIKRRFSRIYNTLGVRGIAQLNRVLTACQFYRY